MFARCLHICKLVQENERCKDNQCGETGGGTLTKNYHETPCAEKDDEQQQENHLKRKMDNEVSQNVPQKSIRLTIGLRHLSDAIDKSKDNTVCFVFPKDS